MITALFGLHASLTISRDTLEQCLTAASNADVGFHVHCAEGREDVFDALAKYDQRVIERFAEAGVLSDKTLAVHCIHVTEGELDLLQDSKAAVIHNPQSNMSNAVGVSPVLEMCRRGILVGLGTDGYTADVTESYKTAAILHKHAASVPSVAWAEPPAMLFDNNPVIMERFIDGRVGRLEKGAYADIIILDYPPPTPLTADNLNGHLLFGASGRQVDTTIINGKVVMRERVLEGIDEQALLAHSREHAAALWKRI
jgi:cytosine/adenosine deaminase-related metal-dependent hydrolase